MASSMYLETNSDFEYIFFKYLLKNSIEANEGLLYYLKLKLATV